MRLTLLIVATLAGVALAGQGYLFPQSACRVRCDNGGACAYDTEDPSIHSCICLVGVYEGERCERLVPGAVDPAAAATTTTTTVRPTQPATPSAYELEVKRHEEQRLRHMEERRKHEEERKRMEEERRRIMEDRARQEEMRKKEMENRGREEEARRRTMEEEQRRRADEERRREDERRQAEERGAAEQQRRRMEEEERREKEMAMNNNHKEPRPDPPHKLDYEEYEDSMDGEHMEEVPEGTAATVDDEDEDEDIDHVEAAEMEKQKEEEEDEEEDEPEVTPEPTTAVTYEVEHDYVTSTTPTVDKEAAHDDSKMSGEEDDYWNHTPDNPDIDEEGNKILPPLTGEDVVRGTQIDQSGRAVGGGVSPLDEEDEELEQDGDDGWMMVKKKQTAASSSPHHLVLTTTITVALTRWLL